MDYLINGLKSDNNQFNQNFIEIQVKMTLLGYGQEFLAFFFEIVDEGFFIEFHAGNYDYDSTIDGFDAALRLDDKLKTLEILGNDIFVDFVSDGFNENRNLVMLTTFVRLLIDARMYVNIVHSDILYHEEFT